MRSTDYESAIVRFESRINSPALSEVLKGLIGTLNGDDNADYFRNLSYKLKEFELNRLRKEANSIPDKLSKYSNMCIGEFVMIIMTIMIIAVVQESNIFF